jgi:predicted molibdopterin-dependent oxidoreductase YjgC
MSTLFIDGRECEFTEGDTVLLAARKNGIHIPTLCFHPALKPSGSCRVCVVETTARSGRPIAQQACILPAKENMAVKTTGEIVDAARAEAFRNLLAMAPGSRKLRQLATEYGVDVGPPPDDCIRCRLCVRVCREVVGPAALKMEKRDGVNYVVPIEGRCIGCGTCANICPTDAIHMVDEENVRMIRIRDETIGHHPLERCEGCGRMFATPRFLNHIEARATAHHPDVKEHHHYCPTCAKLFSDRTRAMGLPRR